MHKLPLNTWGFHTRHFEIGRSAVICLSFVCQGVGVFGSTGGIWTGRSIRGKNAGIYDPEPTLGCGRGTVMGEVRRRGNIWWIRYYRNGRRIEESAETTKYDEARDLLKKREGAIAHGVPITQSSTRFTFDDAVKDVLADYTVNGKKSKDWVQRRIDLHLTPEFGGRRLSTISGADLIAFSAKRLEAKASPAEVNRELAIVRRAFRLAVKNEKYHGRVPPFQMLAEDNVRSGFFDREMFESLRAQLAAALRPVVTFAFVCGWRVQSEILPLEWRNVDRKAHTVRLDVGTTKNKRGRHIDYSSNPELVMLFDELWQEHEALQKATKPIVCRYVFQRHGKCIKDFRGAWDVACRAAGLAGRRPHDLRRSAVRNLVRSGVPDTVAMKITGHLTRSVFDRYDITSEADIREGLGKVATGTNRGDNAAHASGHANKQSA
jgi:integrase